MNTGLVQPSPSLSYHFPGDTLTHRGKALEHHIYPFNKVEKFQTIKATADSLEKIFTAQSISPSFFVSFHSDNGLKEAAFSEPNENLLDEINKNYLYYYFCVDIKDFAFQTLDNKGQTSFAVLPKFLCIKTFFPSFEFYQKVLSEITDYVLSQRILLAKSNKTVSNAVLADLTNLKFEFEDYRLETQGTRVSNLLMALFETKIVDSFPAFVQLSNRTLPLPVYSYENMWAVEGLNGALDSTAQLSLEDLVLIFVGLMNEINLIFISENMRVLTSSV